MVADGLHFNTNELTTGSLRQYYVRALWDDEFIYDPRDPDERAHLLTEP
jgi:hypothetical protein